MMRRVWILVLGVILIYLAVAYVVLPWAWNIRTRRHPDLSASPRITEKAGLGAGRPSSSVVVGFTTASMPAVSNMSLVNWFQEHQPALQVW